MKKRTVAAGPDRYFLTAQSNASQVILYQALKSIQCFHVVHHVVVQNRGHRSSPLLPFSPSPFPPFSRPFHTNGWVIAGLAGISIRCTFPGRFLPILSIPCLIRVPSVAKKPRFVRRAPFPSTNKYVKAACKGHWAQCLRPGLSHKVLPPSDLRVPLEFRPGAMYAWPAAFRLKPGLQRDWKNQGEPALKWPGSPRPPGDGPGVRAGLASRSP